jgi:hypothetical protein
VIHLFVNTATANAIGISPAGGGVFQPSELGQSRGKNKRIVSPFRIGHITSSSDEGGELPVSGLIHRDIEAVDPDGSERIG